MALAHGPTSILAIPPKLHPCNEHDGWQLACQVWEIRRSGHACEKCRDGCTYYCRACGFTWLVPDVQSLLRIQAKKALP